MSMIKLSTDSASTHVAVFVLVAALDQIRTLLNNLTDEQYYRTPGGALVSSVGGHVRHNLDHVSALLSGFSEGAINYDLRTRGTAIEFDRAAAIATIDQLQQDLEQINWYDVSDSLRLSVVVSPDQAPLELLTTPARELAFVISHTVHHNALIAVIVAAVGAVAPVGFGYAPSTLAYQRGQSCVH